VSRTRLVSAHRAYGKARVEAIRRVLSEAEALGFTGEGYRKGWAT